MDNLIQEIIIGHFALISVWDIKPTLCNVDVIEWIGGNGCHRKAVICRGLSWVFEWVF